MAPKAEADQLHIGGGAATMGASVSPLYQSAGSPLYHPNYQSGSPLAHNSIGGGLQSAQGLQSGAADTGDAATAALRSAGNGAESELLEEMHKQLRAARRAITTLKAKVVPVCHAITLNCQSQSLSTASSLLPCPLLH